MQTQTSVKVSGFSMIRNGVIFDYPFEESIRSALPLVDEFIVNVGKGDDTTLERIQALKNEKDGHKIKIFETVWPLDDENKKKKGVILSEQTNLALSECRNDWCLYLQADEVLHEEDLALIRTSVQSVGLEQKIEGLLFNYLHFYGSYDVVQKSRSAYRREVRIIRKSSGAVSVGDAQSFRKKDGSKLKVIHCEGRIFHYGWVRKPEAMKRKTYFMDQLYHGQPGADDSLTEQPHTGDNYRYKKFWGLQNYSASHPGVMRDRIQNQGWHWDLKNSPWVWSVKDLKKVFLDTVEKWTGIRFFEYQSYILLKKPRNEGTKP